MRTVRRAVSAASFVALLAACSQQQQGGQSYSLPTELPGQIKAIASSLSGQPTPAPKPAPPPAPPQQSAAPPPGGSGGLSLQAVNDAGLGQGGAPATSGRAGEANATGEGNAAAQPAPDPVLIKAEVLLDRANVSPGVIDGQDGENFRNALVAYEKMHGVSVSQNLTPEVWQALTADKAPVLRTYQITSQDVAGPWSPDVGEDFVKMSKLDRLGYTSPLEMLAERFHMSQDLLKALNPGANFGKPGTTIVVADPGSPQLPEVASIDVNKAEKSVTAYDSDHKVLAVFPATVGSTERPSPKGTWKVKGVSQHPDYVYNPAKLTWGPKKAGKLTIPPGPNNPVGVVWIALTAPDYGIHGTPDPKLVGKTASHGCVRLTNWDAEELSQAVKPGVKVTFVSSGPDRSNG